MDKARETRMSQRTMLPPDFVVRPPRIEDAEAVAEVINACRLADAGVADTNTVEVLDDWHGTDLASEAVLVIAPDGQIAGCADLVNRAHQIVSVYGYVRPERRGMGIGSFLVDWGERWIAGRIDAAPPGARVVVQHYVLAGVRDAERLFTSRGYEPVRQIYEMAIDLDRPTSIPPPEGLEIRNFVPGRDDHACHAALEDAFRDLWGRPPGPFERFQELTRRPDFDPSLWLLAWDGPEIVGVVLGSAIAGNGWIQAVGVRRPWRGRGLGLALLRNTFAAYGRLGISHVGLSVDAESATGAPRLYLRAGMRVERSYLLYRKEIRPGADLTAT